MVFLYTYADNNTGSLSPFSMCITGELSYIVANLLDQNGNMVVVNGTKVQLVDDPLFINVEEDGSENLCMYKKHLFHIF